MCDPKPGARCSADTWKELQHARSKADAARRDLDRAPEDPSVRRRLHQAESNLTEKSAAYDSSPRGQRELADKIDSAVDPNNPELDQLRTRLCAGRATRIAQKQALARSRGLSGAEEALEVERALNRLRHPDGGYTRHPNTGREESIGFFVSPYPDREVAIPVDRLRPIDILRFGKANADLLRMDYHYEGAWHDPETGIVSLDVSVKTLDAAEARRLAEQHQQVAFFDAQTGASVEVDPNARDRISHLNEGNPS